MPAAASEILFNPGRVTISTELGLVRGFTCVTRRCPAHWKSRAPERPSRIGKAQTLVVSTTGMSRTAPLVGRIGVGAGARATERISLKDPDTLEIESTLTAPAVLTGPLKSVNRYKRARDRVYTEFDICVRDDRSFDEASKAERFDTTPPPDLPPPPTGINEC